MSHRSIALAIVSFKTQSKSLVEELTFLELIAENKEARRFLANPLIGLDKKMGFLDSLALPTCHEAKHLREWVIERRNWKDLHQIALEIKKLTNFNTVQIEAFDTDTAKLAERLSYQILGLSELNFETKIDPTLGGGFIVKTSSHQVFDVSLSQISLKITNQILELA